MAGVVEGFRWALLGGARPALGSIALAASAGWSSSRPARLLPAAWSASSRTWSDACATRQSVELEQALPARRARRPPRQPARRDRPTARGRRCTWRGARRRPDREGRLGAARRQLRGPARRGARHHRPQRRRQEHAAEDPRRAITEPDAGRGRASRGRVGALLEVGTGFHPELTGRENVFLNGAILGMTRRGDQAQVRRDRRVRRGRAVHRHAGQALLERHVRAPRVRGRRAPRARDPDRRRGARGRRRGVPAQVPRQDGRGRAARAARCCSSATTCPRSRRSPTDVSGSTRGACARWAGADGRVYLSAAQWRSSLGSQTCATRRSARVSPSRREADPLRQRPAPRRGRQDVRRLLRGRRAEDRALSIDDRRPAWRCSASSPLEGVLVFTLASGLLDVDLAPARGAQGHDPTEPAAHRPVHARPLRAHGAAAGLPGWREDVRGGRLGEPGGDPRHMRDNLGLVSVEQEWGELRQGTPNRV